MGETIGHLRGLYERLQEQSHSMKELEELEQQTTRRR